jgi:hypothetical protein
LCTEALIFAYTMLRIYQHFILQNSDFSVFPGTDPEYASEGQYSE